MTPWATKPFDGVSIARIAAGGFKRIDDIVEAHLPHAVQQSAGIFQHNARLFSLFDELGDELTHALIAPDENRRVVIIADVRVLHHVLQVADELRCLNVVAARRDQRLVHVECDGEGRFDAIKVDARFGPKDLRFFRGGVNNVADVLFMAGDIR